MGLEIIEINIDDLHVCSQLYIDTFRASPWNEDWNKHDAFERLSDFLSCPNTISVKAILDGQVIGFLIGEVQQWNGFKFFYLKEICVANSAQRKGIGKILIKNLEKSLQKRGVSRMYLITQRESIPSKFYSSLGFTENHKLLLMGKSLENQS